MLGHLLKPGERFESVTKKLRRYRSNEILCQGCIEYFEHKKRKYLCFVEGIVETRTGLWRGSIWTGEHNLTGKISGRRWWQFTYLLTVIEN
jgi:hypothetical protein